MLPDPLLADPPPAPRPLATVAVEGGPPEERELRRRAEAAADLDAYFARNSRSFRFAARFFPRAAWAQVAGVYAYCRITDDLVDRPAGQDPAGLLNAWLRVSRSAYHGRACGIPLVDRVMAEMAAAGVSFALVEELAAGMRMDLEPRRYASMTELRLYTRRVAGVVGEWLARLAGITAPPVLEAAGEMGHAMQLTNILRDVGEDWRSGRLYLPSDVLARHGVTEADLDALSRGERAPGAGYRALTEELLREAEASYRLAMPRVIALPPGHRAAVAVAARVYAGIHRPLRSHGYDNFRRRAATTPVRKVWLAAGALCELLRLRSAGRALVPVSASAAPADSPPA
jgi:15-cis-phytoene synthase